ncbi:carboxymuconolactone decarboxylase family protein [Aquimarina litoralis]|uniref:carboxymuconolactone decarboxylase family protein n=1 Tax=Aquimarina litoralis TaxID=584605 RepID=UPI001C59205B|nr:carboxymuconolactone decarboxylase family protein [Aquimarina litoralis]
MERIRYQDLPKGMFDHLMGIEDFINTSTLDTKLLELLRLLVSQKNGCAYCVDMHHKLLKHEGETELRLASLCVWEETPYFTDKERAVLKFTETLTELQRAPIPDEIFDTLTNFFSKEEISYLTLAISQINTWTRLMKTFKFTPGNFKIPQHEQVQN